MIERLANRSARIAVALLMLLAVGGAAAAFAWPSGGLPRGVAFDADGDSVTATQLRTWASSMKALYGVEIPSSPAEQAQFWRSAAKAMATEAIVSKAAISMGITVTQAQANMALSQYVVSVYGAGAAGQRAFATALINAGSSLPAVQAEFRRVMINGQVFTRVAAHTTTPSASQLATGYQRWICRLGTPETRHIQNIVVIDAPTAKTVKAELAAGVAWNDAVRRWSQDNTTVSKQGDIGWHQASDLQPAFAKAAFAATPGVVFGPISTPVGYDIGRVLAVRSAATPTFQSSRQQIGQWLQAEQQSKLWADWITKKVNSGQVRYAPEYRPNAKTVSSTPTAQGTSFPASCATK